MKGEPEIFRRNPISLWYVLHPDSVQRDEGGSTESIACVQGQGEGSRGLLVFVPISEGIPQDVLESFGVQEVPEDLHLAPEWEQSTPLFSGEMREFLPAHLGDLDWSSGERSLSGCLVQSLVSGFAIHLRIALSEEEGMPSWELWGSTGWRRLWWLRWRVIWRLWKQSLNVGTDTGLPLDPMVGLRILGDS